MDDCIRRVKEEDILAIRDIYAYYVKNTAITFDYEVPTIDKFSAKVYDLSAHYPYFVLEMDEQILGFAYAQPFNEKAAYQWSCELTIYLAPHQKNKGFGRKLYDYLEEALRAQEITNLYACITYPEADDPYVSLNSVQFHHHLGFEEVGRFHRCAYKFKRWYDMVWIEKRL